MTYVRTVPNLPYSDLVSRATDALARNTDLTYDTLANVLTATRYLGAAPITTTSPFATAGGLGTGAALSGRACGCSQ